MVRIVVCGVVRGGGVLVVFCVGCFVVCLCVSFGWVWVVVLFVIWFLFLSFFLSLLVLKVV